MTLEEFIDGSPRRHVGWILLFIEETGEWNLTRDCRLIHRWRG